MADPTPREPRDRLQPTDAVQRLWEGDLGLGGRILDALLTPAELGYRAAMRARNAAYGSGVMSRDDPPVPAISVGNITVGGTGKTPMVRWLVRRLVKRGYTPGILHGGYAEDEPALHRLWFPDLPVVAEKDRLRAAGRALEMGADVLVLDDAFQHRRIGRDLDIVLVAAETWTRDARLLPRGPFREPPTALRRAGVVVVTRRSATDAEAAEVEAEVGRVSGRPTARALLGPGPWLRPDGTRRPGVPGPSIAVAGVARPDDFFDQAEQAAADLYDAIAFPDHHAFTAEEARALIRLAEGDPIVMTAKDAVKLAPLMRESDLWVLEQQVVFESGRAVILSAVQETLS
jgi:tetraacyldisaccharide 4'-kinase